MPRTVLKRLWVGIAMLVSLAAGDVANGSEPERCEVFEASSVRNAASELLRTLESLDHDVEEAERLSPSRVMVLIQDQLEQSKEQFARLTNDELKVFIQDHFDRERAKNPAQFRGSVSSEVTLEEMLQDLQNGGGQLRDVWGNWWQSMGLQWAVLQGMAAKPDAKLKPEFYSQFKEALMRALPLEVLRVRLIEGKFGLELASDHSFRALHQYQF